MSGEREERSNDFEKGGSSEEGLPRTMRRDSSGRVTYLGVDYNIKENTRS